jgi:hypothetical protein
MIFFRKRLRKIAPIKPQQEQKLSEIITQEKIDNSPSNRPPVPPEAIAQDRELMRIKGIFPFDLFPDELIIAEQSISVKRNYLISSNTETMLIKDIGLVTINDGIFFASLIISYKAPNDDVRIKTLWPSDAYRAKSFLEKLVIKYNQDSQSPKPDETAILSP